VADLVKKLEERQAVGDLLLVLGHYLDGNTLVEVDGKLVGLVRSIDRVQSATSKICQHLCTADSFLLQLDENSRPELLRGGVVGVLKDTSLIRAVHKIVC